jgi:N-acetylglucosaminyl-diphospho-decaprenol L-rhamnosyltransferase
MTDLGIIILSHNTKDMTLDCLRSLYKYPPSNKFEVYVVDNASNDGSPGAIRKNFPQVKLIASDTNAGFSAGNNLVLKKIYQKAKYCLLLNSDTVLMPDSFDRLFAFAERTGYGVTSCRLLFSDKSFQANVGSLPTLLPLLAWLSGFDDIFKHFISIPSYHQESKQFYRGEREVGWISGSVFLIAQKVLKKIGFLDERIFMYGEDAEYCLRAHQAGFKLGWTDAAQIVHLGGASSHKPKQIQWTGEFRGLLYIYKKHYGPFAQFLLKLLFYVFIFARIIAFLVVGNVDHAKTYAKVIVSI